MLIFCPNPTTADKVRAQGHTPVVPLLCTDLALLARCDAVVCELPAEKAVEPVLDYAAEHGIPVYVATAIPPLHPTEVRSPRQAEGFITLVMQMYRTHLRKNADYSSAPILIPGEVGVVVRLTDKVLRLLNLSGFRFEVTGTGVYTAPQDPSNEAIEDTYLDTAVYALIALLLRRGVWGR